MGQYDRGLAFYDGLSGRAPERLEDSYFPPPHLEEPKREVLPEFPGSWLAACLSRLSPGDINLVLRHKVIPIAWMPSIILYGVACQSALNHCIEQNLKMVSRVNLWELHAAIKQRLGQRILQSAVFGLFQRSPLLSAKNRFSTGQMVWIILISSFVAFLFAANGSYIISIIAGFFFVLPIAIRMLCLLPEFKRRRKTLPLTDFQLPVYTVLVPLFRETEVLPQLISALTALDYPADKLDIKLILEDEDVGMHRAVAKIALPHQFEVIIVPRGKPQTKPRALNYALAFARGSLLTIYDCEDIPERDQLRKAASAFQTMSTDVACLQAKLTFYNANENWITRQFTAEYAALFNVILPGLASNGLPLPLGGTSNHFRMAALVDSGAWDPFNVTEDADLGYRLGRLGYQTNVLDSTTYEEANTQYWNWQQQRRRWLKGFLQTWFVHMRQPVKLWKELGWDGFLTFQAMTIGSFGSSLLHPLLFIQTMVYLASDEMSLRLNGLGAIIVSLSVSLLFAGYAVGIFTAYLGLRRSGIRHWPIILATIPMYWFMMMPSAWMALWDFAVRPHHWHKTRHGLSRFLRKPTRPSSP